MKRTALARHYLSVVRRPRSVGNHEITIPLELVLNSTNTPSVDNVPGDSLCAVACSLRGQLQINAVTGQGPDVRGKVRDSSPDEKVHRIALCLSEKSSAVLGVFRLPAGRVYSENNYGLLSTRHIRRKVRGFCREFLRCQSGVYADGFLGRLLG
jgi:hypothetical protein